MPRTRKPTALFDSSRLIERSHFVQPTTHNPFHRNSPVAMSPTASAKSSTQPTFTILYFASACDFTTVSSETLPAPLPLSQLFPALESRHPGITAKVLKSCAVTVNLEYIDVDEDVSPTPDQAASTEEPGSTSSTGEASTYIIQPGDEVGIIPPVSSG